jgi:hypothetical protein
LDQGNKHVVLHHCSRAQAGMALADGPSWPQPPTQTHPMAPAMNGQGTVAGTTSPRATGNTATTRPDHSCHALVGPHVTRTWAVKVSWSPLTIPRRLTHGQFVSSWARPSGAGVHPRPRANQLTGEASPGPLGSERQGRTGPVGKWPSSHGAHERLPVAGPAGGERRRENAAAPDGDVASARPFAPSVVRSV